MRDFIEIGPSPCDEEAADIRQDDFAAANREECRRFIEAIREHCGPEVGTAELRIKSFAHDFGTYREVVCCFDDSDELGAAYAYHVESDSPTKWDGTGAKRFDASMVDAS